MNPILDENKLKRMKYQNIYKSGRNNALIAIVFTFASILLLAIGWGSF